MPLKVQRAERYTVYRQPGDWRNREIGKSLPKAVGYGHDLAAREICCWLHAWREWRFPVRGLGYPRDGASNGGGAAYSARSGERMLLPTVMEFNRMVCRERFSRLVGRCELKNPTIVTLLTR